MIKAFHLHPELIQDSALVTNLSLCTVRLMNNAYFPWLLLIPQRAEVSELFDLSHQDQLILLDEINLVASRMKIYTQCHKINIATLGNIVPQLHIHIIARFTHDSAWPKPVWGNGSVAYEDLQSQIKLWQAVIG